MDNALKITFRDMDPTEPLQREIEARFTRLKTIFPRLLRCDVALESPHKHHRRGREIVVRIDLTVPGAELVVNHEKHQDGYAAIRNAFEAAKRRLEYHRERLQDFDPEVRIVDALAR